MSGVENLLTMRTLFIALVASIAALTAFVALVPGQKEYGSGAMVVTAAAATALGGVLVYKQRGHGIKDTATIALTVGLALWYCAEIAWAYSYSGGSIAETDAGQDALRQTGYAFWIAGSIPFIYYLYKTLRFFGDIVNQHVLLAVSAMAVILLSLAIPAYASDLPVAFRFFTYVLFRDVQNPEDIVYVRGDLDDVLMRTVPSFFTAVIVAMSIVILITIRKSGITHTYWVLSTIALTVYGFAEAFRSYSVFTGAGPDALLAAYPFFGASYLIMSVGMLWYIRFFEKIEGIRIGS